MNIEEYKRQFAELFIKMEEEHGTCNIVRVGHNDKVEMSNGTIPVGVEVSIEF